MRHLQFIASLTGRKGAVQFLSREALCPLQVEGIKSGPHTRLRMGPWEKRCDLVGSRFKFFKKIRTIL